MEPKCNRGISKAYHSLLEDVFTCACAHISCKCAPVSSTSHCFLSFTKKKKLKGDGKVNADLFQNGSEEIATCNIIYILV